MALRIRPSTARLRAGLLAALLPVAPLVSGCEQDYALTKEARRLTVSPEVADLGVIAVGETATGAITLAHTKGDEIEVLAIDVLPLDGDAFTLDDGALPVLAPDDIVDLPVLFAPDSEGYFRSRLTLYTNEESESEHTVDLRGRAGQPVLEASPSLLDFGPVDVGETAELPLTLHNAGTVDWTLTALDFTLPVYSSGEALPAVVGAGDDLTLMVRFTPTDAEEAVGTVEPAVAAADTPLVNLLGNACGLGDASLYDEDGDGWSTCANDCDDTDGTAHPGAAEACDGRDDDCDGAIDEGTLCVDDDGDGYSENDGDCSDADRAVSPEAVEIMDNGVDDDCDGTVDLGSDDPDGDGYGAEAGDCDEGDDSVFPGAPETADGEDEDCDGTIDEGTSAYDDDSDGYSEDGGDCDDSAASVSPADTETGNGVDDDCDGAIDEGTTWGDDDRDGWSERGGDCDDADDAINPGAYDTRGDGLDNDCDGVAS